MWRLREGERQSNERRRENRILEAVREREVGLRNRSSLEQTNKKQFFVLKIR